MIRFERQEDGSYTRAGDLGRASQVTIHFEGSVSPQAYSTEAAEEFFRNYKTGKGLKKEWYELRAVAGSERKGKEEVLPELPKRSKPLDYQPIDNVPSIRLSEGTYSIPMFLTDGGERKAIELLRKQPDVSFYSAIIAEQGLQVVDGITAESSFSLVLAVIRLWYHELTSAKGVILDDPTTDVRKAYRIYLQKNKLKIKNIQQAQAKPGVKVGKQPRQPKDITFSISKSGDGLRGEYKQVYEALVALGGTAQVDKLTEEAFKRGYVGKGKNPTYGPRWIALQLVKQDVLFIVGTQSEIPGTPGNLPKR